MQTYHAVVESKDPNVTTVMYVITAHYRIGTVLHPHAR
jgi:hypothetical protein